MTKFLSWICILVVGCLLGMFFSNYEYFVFSRELNLGDCLALALTTFVGLYIAQTIQRQLNANTKEKEIIIEEILSMRNQFINLSKQNDSGTLEFQETITKFKEINTKFIFLEDLFKLSKKCRSIDLVEIKKDFRALRRYITSPSPVNGFLRPDPRKRNLIEKKFQRVQKEIFRIILALNKK